MLPFMHPALDAIVGLADGTLAPKTRARIVDHLQRCPDCQATLRHVRRLERAAAGAPVPPLPADGLARILAARQAGDRAILPVDVAPSAPRRRRPIAVAAAAAVLIVGALVVMPDRDVIAGSTESELTIGPAAPRPGQRITVAYRPTMASLARHERLVLRARLRTPRAESYGRGAWVVTLDTLVRSRDGAFTGAFTLPDSVVYAALAVEDPAAEHVDARDGRAWDVLMHAADGRPALDALEQRAHDFMGASWDEAYTTARRAVELYPGAISAWNDVAFYEGQLLGKAAADTIAKSREPMILSIVARQRQAKDVPARELSALAWRAYIRKDTADQQYWLTRLGAVAPKDEQIAQLEGVRLADRLWRTSPRELADSLEVLWARVGPTIGSGSLVASVGYQVAAQLKDSALYHRWVHRRPMRDSLVETGSDLVALPATRDEGLQRLRAALARSDADVERFRGLAVSRPRHAERTRAAKREILGTVGRALVDAGRPKAALDTLTLAIAEGWDRALLQRVAATRMQLGDTLGALEVHARLAVDPRTSSASIDSMAQRAVRLRGATWWDSARADARRFMVARVLEQSTTRSVPSAEVQTASGAWQPLRERFNGKPALLVYWSRSCGPALQALAPVNALAATLRDRGLATVLVAEEGLSKEVTAFMAEKGVTMDVVYDARREVSKSLRNFGTPSYYLLDRSGQLRFVSSGSENVGAIALQVEALLAGGSPTS